MTIKYTCLSREDIQITIDWVWDRLDTFWTPKASLVKVSNLAYVENRLKYRYNKNQWRGGRAVDGAGLENQLGACSYGGSNPSLSVP